MSQEPVASPEALPTETGVNDPVQDANPDTARSDDGEPTDAAVTSQDGQGKTADGGESDEKPSDSADIKDEVASALEAAETATSVDSQKGYEPDISRQTSLALSEDASSLGASSFPPVQPQTSLQEEEEKESEETATPAEVVDVIPQIQEEEEAPAMASSAAARTTVDDDTKPEAAEITDTTPKVADSAGDITENQPLEKEDEPTKTAAPNDDAASPPTLDVPADDGATRLPVVDTTAPLVVEEGEPPVTPATSPMMMDDSPADATTDVMANDSAGFVAATAAATTTMTTTTTTTPAAAASTAAKTVNTIAAGDQDDTQQDCKVAPTSDSSDAAAKEEDFVNQGLALWEESRSAWLEHSTNYQADSASSSARKQQQQQRAKAKPLEVDDIIDIIFTSSRQVREQGGPRKFPTNVPLPQIIDVLIDLWEAEGLDA